MWLTRPLMTDSHSNILGRSFVDTALAVVTVLPGAARKDNALHVSAYNRQPCLGKYLCYALLARAGLNWCGVT